MHPKIVTALQNNPNSAIVARENTIWKLLELELGNKMERRQSMKGECQAQMDKM